MGLAALISHHLTAGARERPALVSLRLLAVLKAARRGDVATNGDTARQNARATSSGGNHSYRQTLVERGECRFELIEAGVVT